MAPRAWHVVVCLILRTMSVAGSSLIRYDTRDLSDCVMVTLSWGITGAMSGLCKQCSKTCHMLSYVGKCVVNL